MSDTIAQDIAIRECEDLEEMLSVAHTILKENDNWKTYFNKELGRKEITLNEFSKLGGFSYNTVKKWSEGTLPKNRNNFIKIGLALRFQVRDINRLLNRYGKYSSLYPKSWEDAVCIFTINMYRENISVNLVKKYKELLLKYKTLFENTTSIFENQKRSSGTQTMVKELAQIEDEEEFEKFMQSNRRAFADSYGKLIEFLDGFIAIEDDRKELEIIGKGVRDNNSNNIFRKEQNLSVDSIYKKNRRFRTVCDSQLSKLRCHRELPKRKNLIILGIYLNMGLEEINILLSLANMEPLCPKDTVECMLIYALMNIEILQPEYIVEHAVKLRKVENKEWRNYCEGFLKYYEKRYSIMDYDKKIDEVENSVSDYVSSVLEAIANEQPEYEEYIEDYMKFLREE